MIFLNKIKDKIDSTKEFLSNKFGEEENNNAQQYEVIGKDKEINFNQIESKKVKYIKQASGYNLNLQISGKSIFQNLILTASATQNNNEQIPIPIKCQWRRIYEETIITIQDINSFSYMPNAEDIGYIIEVEVNSLDDPGDVAIAQYGPIQIDKEMESAIELFLTSGKNFNLYLFDPNTQEKVKDKEYILYLKNDELILSNYDMEGKEIILEKCIYSQLNPIIVLSPTNANKIKFIFIDYDSSNNQNMNDNNFNFVNEEVMYKKKNEYNFLAMSKQNRELIYLLIQFFVIDEKIKNNKLFSLINKDVVPTDEKLGITDLVGELNSLKKDNILTLHKMDKLNEINKKLSDDYKDLEERFRITLSQINVKNTYLQNEIYKANEINSSYNMDKKKDKQNKINNELKKEFDQLSNDYNVLLSELKELEEEKILLLNKENAGKEKLIESENNLKAVKDLNNELKNKLGIASDKLRESKDVYNRMKNNYEETKKELKKLKEENASLNQKNKENKDLNKNKEEMIEIKKNNEILSNENKALLGERDLLNKQKIELSKELEKEKKEKEILQNQFDELKQNNVAQSPEGNNNEIENLKQKNEELKNQYEKIKEEYDLLIMEQNNLQEKYERCLNNNNLNMSCSVISANGYQLSPEEYEEYDMLRKNKDENEAILMQLKSNNQANEVQIEQLKNMLRNLEQKK